MNARPIAMRDALLTRIHQAMSDDPNIYFVSADFGAPVLDKIRADFPNRFINVGIAEQNLVNISAGLALEGFTVFAYAIAPFITMRCFEQLRVSLALLSELRPMNVNLIGVGAGYSYVVSGPTHQCYEDLSLIRTLPNFRLLSPSDATTSGGLFDLCVGTRGPKYIRLDAQILPDLVAPASPPQASGFRRIRKGRDVCIISTGYMSHVANDVCAEAGANSLGHIDLFDVTHFDRAELAFELASYRGVITLEEGFTGRGGLDAAIREFLNDAKVTLPHLGLGVRPGYSFELGTREELHEQVGLGRANISTAITSFAKKIIEQTCSLQSQAVPL